MWLTWAGYSSKTSLKGYKQGPRGELEPGHREIERQSNCGRDR